MFGLGLVALLTTLAQAEAAPPAPAAAAPAAPKAAPTSVPPPPPTAPVPDSRLAIGVGFGGTRRLGDAPKALGPRHGFEVTALFNAVYARLPDVDLGLGVHFAYQRFRTLVPLSFSSASTSTFESERTFSFYEFHLHQTVAARLGFVRPYVSGGAGITMASFTSQEAALSPANLRATRFGLSATVGCDFLMTRKGEARVGFALTGTTIVRAPELHTDSGRDVPVFGSRASAGVTFLQPF